MSLIKSISGIRGTIGGKSGEGLSPLDLVKFSASFATWVKKQGDKERIKIVVGRDARISGDMVNRIVTGTLLGMGIDVVDLGLATTPTVEMAVPEEQADGGVILTASHNPANWNALKLLNHEGEFLNDSEGKDVLAIAEKESFSFSEVYSLGDYIREDGYDDFHIQKVISLPEVDIESIREKKLKVVVDCVNSVGGIVLPDLLRALGVAEVIEMNCTPDGKFAHIPEPLPENLTGISERVRQEGADLGFVVDPDVDRLAIINEDGTMFGEEYTLVAVADYLLDKNPGNTVSNLSSTRALRDITENHGGKYFASAVGEVNVVQCMKENHAVIGGEGNGGVIYPGLHYGRDALVGIAFFLSLLAQSGKKCSALKADYPHYVISKNKIELTPQINIDQILDQLKNKYVDYPVNSIDGVKIEFEKEWVHLRKSNTEPIIRIYAESKSQEQADKLAQSITSEIKNIIE